MNSPDYKKLYLELVKAVKPLVMASGGKERDRLELSKIYERHVKILMPENE